jgi:hypothetical protein
MEACAAVRDWDARVSRALELYILDRSSAAVQLWAAWNSTMDWAEFDRWLFSEAPRVTHGCMDQVRV